MIEKNGDNYQFRFYIVLAKVVESYYHRELNPHAPKLNDTVYGNDSRSSRLLPFSKYSCQISYGFHPNPSSSM